MKKFYFLIMVLCLTSMNVLYSQDVINLGTTDGIAAKLNAYTGTSSTVTVVIPAGYTSPEYATSNIILTAIPSTITNLVIQGDGTNPTLLMKGLTLPASSLTSLTVKNLTMKGVADPSSGTVSLGNYVAQSAVTVPTVTIDNCTIANFRGVFRMNAGNNFTNLTINNCIMRNIGSYNIFNPGGTLTNLTVTKSTIYGINGNAFALSVTSPVPFPTTVTISDCTFDNIDYVGGKYFIDLGATNTTTALTITNSILGKTLSATAKGINSGAAYTVTNSYTTSDWVTSANNVTGFTAYANASTSLFKSPSTYSSDGTGTEATVGDYTLIDNTVGKIGDPRWYPTSTELKSVKNNMFAYFTDKNLVVKNVEVGSMISVYTFNGLLLNKQTAISNKITIPVNSACILKITSNNETKCIKMIK